MDESDLVGVETSESTISAGRTRSVPVLIRALTILELLANSSNGLTLPEVARRLQIPKSTAHCILLTLLRQDYVARSERTRRYVLGQKLFSLASHALTGQKMREAAVRHLLHLMMTTNLTVHMGVLDGSEAIVVLGNLDVSDKLSVVSHRSLAVRADIRGGHHLSCRVVSQPRSAPAGDSCASPSSRGAPAIG